MSLHQRLHISCRLSCCRKAVQASVCAKSRLLPKDTTEGVWLGVATADRCGAVFPAATSERTTGSSTFQVLPALPAQGPAATPEVRHEVRSPTQLPSPCELHSRALPSWRRRREHSPHDTMRTLGGRSSCMGPLLQQLLILGCIAEPLFHEVQASHVASSPATCWGCDHAPTRRASRQGKKCVESSARASSPSKTSFRGRVT